MRSKSKNAVDARLAEFREGPWVNAPSDSHLHSFRLAFRAWQSAPDGIICCIEVLFKKRGTLFAEDRIYRHLFGLTKGCEVFAFMNVATSPGEVLAEAVASYKPTILKIEGSKITEAKS